MRKPICFNLLISSPMDVSEERDEIEQICGEWNTSFGQDKNVLIETSRWELNLKIDSRESAQDLINNQLVSKCDILIAIFGKRYGSPTQSYDSGTIEEIEQIIKTNKPFFIYFMKSLYSIEELDPEQVKNIKATKNRLRDENRSYKDVEKKDLRKTFTTDLTHHVNQLIKEQEKINSSEKNEKIETIEGNEDSKKLNWFELSISDIINRNLADNNQSFAIYKRGITFSENCIMWKSLSGINHKALIENAMKAREFAFNSKYGGFDYSKDLRNNYSNWYDEVLKILKEAEVFDNDLSVIGVGSNYGQELHEIFNNNFDSKVNLSVLDISNDAIEKGKKMFPHITFYKGNMEESPLKIAEFDIYLNLRSIHSSGIDFKLALMDAYRVLKPNGIIIISVSNGYLTPKKQGSNEMFEIQGLYDNRTEIFSKHRPYELARKIFSKLTDYGFKNTAITTGKTEIFIYAKK